MNKKTKFKKIVFCTFSDLKSGNAGDAVNDLKLYNSISNKYKRIKISPEHTNKSGFKVKSLVKFIITYLKENFGTNKLFITRASKLAILPILLRRLFKNKIVVRLGCGPLGFIEKQAFNRNNEYNTSKNIFKKIGDKIEYYLELFALKKADKFIVENEKAKRIVIYYGADEKKIKIIPYFVEDFFLKGENPSYDKEKDYFKMGYTGRFKEYDLLIPVIEAIDLLVKEGYLIKLFLIGNGPTHSLLKNIVYKKGLSKNIIFLGSKSHIKVSKLIETYHCLILPMLPKLSPSTIAIKVLEGVMKGKIVITTNSGNNPSLFLKATDLILNNSSALDISEKIKIIVQNYEKYRNIAENIKDYHIMNRSKGSVEKEIDRMLTDLII